MRDSEAADRRRRNEQQPPTHSLATAVQQQLGRLAGAWEHAHASWDRQLQSFSRGLQHHWASTAAPVLMPGGR